MEISIAPLRIRAFQATRDPDGCAMFLREHRRVLEDFGISNVTTNEDHWMTDPDTYVIVAEDAELGMVGGVRIQFAKPGEPLPMEQAIGDLDPKVAISLARLLNNNNAELCGLWISNRYVRKGLPLLLGYASTSLTSQLGLSSLVCLVAHYTLHHPLRVGFRIMDEVGLGGTFTYPIPSIKAIALVADDLIAVDAVSEHHRKRILSLRMRPDQIATEQPTGSPVSVHYSLDLLKDQMLTNQYTEIERSRLHYSA